MRCNPPLGDKPLADPWNRTGSGRMRRERDTPSPVKLPINTSPVSWNYPNANPSQYDELNVQELLHGLEAESANAPASSRLDRSKFPVPEPSDPETVCHGCQRKNPAAQRFCGYCGTRLVELEPPVREKARETWPFAPARENFESRHADRGGDIDNSILDDDDEEDLRRAAWPGGPEATRDRSASRSSSAAGPAADDELQFLRHTVGGDDDESSGRRWKVGLAVLVLGAAGFGGYRWFVNTRTPVHMYSAAALPPEAQDSAISDDPSEAKLPGAAQTPAGQAAPQTAENSDQAAPEVKTAGKSDVSGTKDDSAAKQSAPAHLSVGDAASDVADTPETQPQQKPAAQAATPEPAPTVDGGQQELSVAERYLSGADGARDSGEAAKWLWRAVGKQNGRAILLLSGLYANGDGVAKNCDQARLLLLTAVKKKVPNSVEGLQKLEMNGCQ